MKYILLITILLSCKNEPRKEAISHVSKDTTSQGTVKPDTPTLFAHEYKYKIGKDTGSLMPIMNKIFTFPEVVEANNQISKTSQGKHGVAIMVREGFNGDTGYYNFIVGDNSHEDRFATIFNFLLEKKTGQLKAYEPVADSIMSIEAWRRARK